MAKPTHHSALESLGFKLTNQGFNGSSDHVGSVFTNHYALTRNTVGDGSLVRPITHHVFVDEFDRAPGKYNVSYHVTQDGEPYSEGDFDTLRRHKDNVRNGSSDPIKEIVTHHHGVMGALKRQQAPSLESVTEDNLHRLAPGSYHMTPGWGADDPGMKSQRFIVPGPEYPMQRLNAAEDQPLDSEVHRRLTSGSRGSLNFQYHGRFPGESGTDVYHASYSDPDNPHTFEYGFTVRHRPESDKPFSYNATRYQGGHDDNGEEDVGSFLDVTGDMDHVANFSTVPQLIKRHQDMLRSLRLQREASGPVSDEDWESFVAGRNPVSGMMPNGIPVVHHFDPDFGQMGQSDSRGVRSMTYLPHAVERAASGETEVYEPRGRCVTCGRPTWNTSDGGQAPEWESTGNSHYAEDYEMHGPDIPQCANCANEHGTYKEAIRAGQRPGGLWHHPGARPNTCDKCSDDGPGRSIMERADDDLRP